MKKTTHSLLYFAHLRSAFGICMVLAVLPLFSSCLFHHSPHPCTDPTLYMYIPSVDTVLDSSAYITLYKPGADFTELVDSVEIEIVKGAIPYDFTSAYDYQVAIRPRGRIHTLKGIQFGSDMGEYSTKQSETYCANSVSYFLDGSLKKLPWRYTSEQHLAEAVNIQ